MKMTVSPPIIGLLSFVVSLFFNLFAFAHSPTSIIGEGPWNGKVYNTKTRQLISMQALTEQLKKSDVVVIGEKHYSETTQKAEALLIEMGAGPLDEQTPSFSTAWEFLNYDQQLLIDQAYDQYLKREIDTDLFMNKIHGGKYSSMYGPLFESTRNLQGQVLAVNLSREAKAPILEKGLEGIEASLIPPDFAVGSLNYHQRFKEIMAGHGDAAKIEKYYLAQCLTDDVMAYQIEKNQKTKKHFLITGSFHMEFNDGVVERLRTRMKSATLTSIRIVDVNDFLVEEIDDLIHDPRFGDIADIVYFVREPYNPHSEP
ncbi:MAG: hypothetical protein RJB66_1875 [Pseudomonadota bacterium]|jgi:uncharacterized iron-regulated protein